MNYKWTCPECGSKFIEEVVTDVIEYFIVNDLVYNEVFDIVEILDSECVETHGGDVTRYQCYNCGKEISDTELKTTAILNTGTIRAYAKLLRKEV